MPELSTLNKDRHTSSDPLTGRNGKSGLKPFKRSGTGKNDQDSDNFLTTRYFPFLKGVKDEHLKSINARIVYQRLDKKAYIYLPFDDNERVYFIVHGNIEIGCLDESGREFSIDILGPGEMFGSFMGRGINCGFARALDNGVLGVLQRADFERFLEKFPRFSYKVIRLMGERIGSLEKKLQNFVFSDVKTRICKLLFALYEKSGDKQTGQIRIPLTHQDIANLVASSRETASLHLSELKKSGWIAYERKRIRIISLEALQREASTNL